LYHNAADELDEALGQMDARIAKRLTPQEIAFLARMVANACSELEVADAPEDEET
jgi:hypothetical protein